MPEATVNDDCTLTARDGDVRRTRKRFPVKTVSYLQRPKYAAYLQFGGRVTLTHARHERTSRWINRRVVGFRVVQSHRLL
jgi:hypothetical protein